MSLSENQQLASLAQQRANLGLSGLQQQGALTQQAGQLGLQAGQLGQQQAQQLGSLGLQFGQLGQADVAQQLAMAGQQAQLGQGLGSLAGMYGQLGQQYGTMGLQQAGLGELQQQMNLRDIQTLAGLGATERGVQQANLDAMRQSNLAMQAFPYQQYAFLSDIYKGTPSAQQTITSQASQQPSTFQQVAGLGIAGLSAAAGAREARII
jgi:hypothetical protein